MEARGWFDWTRAPKSGIAALFAVFAMLAVAHTFVVLQRDLIGAHSVPHTLVSLVAGALGFVLIWLGFKRPPGQATVLGYLAGNLIWVGWFEWTWEYFGHWLRLDPVMDGDIPILMPGLLMIQATSLIVIAMLVYLGANKDTQCRMFMWFHRNLGLKPGTRTRGYRRQISRTVAIETVFIIWFIYLCAITINDPRLIKYDSVAAMAITVGFVFWGLYLAAKLFKINGAGAALRYAIPTGGVLWLPIEAFSRWGLYPEIWVKPAQFPLAMSAILLLLIVLLVGLFRAPEAQAASESAEPSLSAATNS